MVTDVTQATQKTEVPAPSSSTFTSKGRRGFFSRMLLWTGLLALLTGGALLAALGYVSRESFLKPLIIHSISERTGAKVSLESVSLNVYRGFTINNLSLNLPAPGDSRGYLNGGAVEIAPAIKISELALVYRPLKFFSGCLCIEKVHLDGLRLSLQESATGTNLDSISAYRATLPVPLMVEQKEPTAERPVTPQTIGAIAAFIPRVFTVRLASIGLKDAEIQVQPFPYQAGKNVGSHLAFDFESALSLTEKRRLEHHMKVTVSKLEKGPLSLEPLQIDYEMNLVVDENYQGANLEQLDLSIGTFLVQKVAGSIKFLDENYARAEVRLDQSLRLDLAKALDLVRPNLPAGLVGAGVISVEGLQVKGMLDARPGHSLDLQSIAPRAAAKFVMKDVGFSLPAQGILLGPSDFQLTFRAEPTEAKQLDMTADWSGRFPELLYDKREARKKRLKAELHDVNVNGTFQGNYPALEVSQLEADVKVLDLGISGTGLPTLKTPLDVRLRANGSGMTQAGNGELQVDAGPLLRAKLDASATNSLSRLVAKWDFSVGALAAWHRLAEQLPELKAISGFPNELRGKLSSQGDVVVSLPDNGKLDSVNPLKGVSSNYDVNLRLEGLEIRSPLLATRVTNLNSQMKIVGDLRTQKVNWQVGLDSLALELSQARAMELSGLSVNLNLNNQVSAEPDPRQVLQQSVITQSMAVSLGGLTCKDLIPFPINGLQVNLAAELRNGQALFLRELKAQIPQLGILSTTDGEVWLNSAMQPKSFALNTQLKVDTKPDSLLPPELKVSGVVDLTASAKSKDMTQVEVAGKALFDSVNLQIMDLAKNSEILSVKNLQGLVPFVQTIALIKPSEETETPGEPTKAEFSSQTKNSDEQNQAEDTVLAKSVDRFLKGRVDLARASPTLMNAVSYQDMRPFYAARRPITIDEVTVKDFKLKHVEVDAQVSQNWISVNELMFEVLGGKVQGEFQYAFDPKPSALKSTIHLTRLDTHELVAGIPGLREKAASWVLVSDPYVDAAIHFNYDFRSNDMSGAVEVTSIGQEQLKMLLYYLDPDSQNPTLSQIKKALLIGEIKLVSIPIKNGFIGLEVDIRLLKAPIPTPKLQRFPIAELLENFKPKQLQTESKEPSPGTKPTPSEPPAERKSQSEIKETAR